jgi:A/G-specific adenine glycosylase
MSAVSGDIAGPLLAWYDRHARRLPWRVGPRDRAKGILPDPYRIWLSEVMLQQTTVRAVAPYFARFVERWPTVADLAAAPQDDVMRLWAGLGYYARARNLKACAETIVRDHGGEFPRTAAALGELQGVGSYTAAAIAAIAFDQPAAVVDGNVERVIARLDAIATPLRAAKASIRERQSELTPHERAGDYAQAMMDLGATICTPARPACALCPISTACAAYACGHPEAFPVKAAKTERPTRFGTAFVAVRQSDGAVLLRRRPEKGLLGGMAEVPGSIWTARPPKASPPFRATWRDAGTVIHVFTHFRLELAVRTAVAPAGFAIADGAWWARPDALPGEALPSVMRKAIETAAPGATRRQPGKSRAA